MAWGPNEACYCLEKTVNFAPRIRTRQVQYWQAREGHTTRRRVSLYRSIDSHRHNRPKTGQSSIESSFGRSFLRRNLGLSGGFNVLLCPTCSQRNLRPERAPWIRFGEIRYPGEGQVRGLEGT